MENAMAWDRDSQGDDKKPGVHAAAERRRADTYRLLADVFNAEPSAEVLDAIRHPEAANAFETLGATFAKELDRLEAELGKAGMVDELACEFARLFIGPGKHVGPYESLHRDDHPSGHWGPSTAEVKRFIEHHGVGYAERFKGMPDHISAEFQFISMLADVEADAIERGESEKADQAREIQRVFRQEHLARWVPVFCEKVIELANLDFYRNFARIAKAVVAADSGVAEDGKPELFRL